MHGHLFRRLMWCSTVVSFMFAAGCASYATPGRAAEMKLFAADQQGDPSVMKTIDRRPMATLPTAVAVVRVQAPGYSSETAKGWGNGAYSIVTERDIENQEQELDELRQKMPMYVYGIAEATDRQSQLASAWTSEAAVDQTRKRVEGKAFAKLVEQLEQTWPGVVANLQVSQAAPPVSAVSSGGTQYHTGE